MIVNRLDLTKWFHNNKMIQDKLEILVRREQCNKIKMELRIQLKMHMMKMMLASTRV